MVQILCTGRLSQIHSILDKIDFKGSTLLVFLEDHLANLSLKQTLGWNSSNSPNLCFSKETSSPRTATLEVCQSLSFPRYTLVRNTWVGQGVL